MKCNLYPFGIFDILSNFNKFLESVYNDLVDSTIDDSEKDNKDDSSCCNSSEINSCNVTEKACRYEYVLPSRDYDSATSFVRDRLNKIAEDFDNGLTVNSDVTVFFSFGNDYAEFTYDSERHVFVGNLIVSNGDCQSVEYTKGSGDFEYLEYNVDNSDECDLLNEGLFNSVQYHETENVGAPVKDDESKELDDFSFAHELRMKMVNDNEIKIMKFIESLKNEIHNGRYNVSSEFGDFGSIELFASNIQTGGRYIIYKNIDKIKDILINNLKFSDVIIKDCNSVYGEDDVKIILKF